MPPIPQAKLQLLQILYWSSFFGATSPCYTGILFAQAAEAWGVLMLKIDSMLASVEYY